MQKQSSLIVVMACTALAAGCSNSGGNSNGGGGNQAASGGATASAGQGAGPGTGGAPGTAGGGNNASGTGGTSAGLGGTNATGGQGGLGIAGSSALGGAAGETTGTGGTSGTGATGGTTIGGGATSGPATVIKPAGAKPSCQAPTAVTTGTAASVTADLATIVRASVSPDFMGIHTAVYDSNMLLPTTPDLLKAAGVKSVRYPGGSYGDVYHWSLHTGTYTPAAGAGSNTIYVAPSTHFGAFAQFIEKIGADALITVNYGMNSRGDGPGEPKEAAAWVAYANGTTTSTVTIGADSRGTDWKTVAYWASMRAAAPLATDDGYNKFRISHAAPFGIKYWEVGNEEYGNGYYYGGCGWEADMHVAYPASGVCTDRKSNAALSPAAYGKTVKAYAEAIHAVDPNAKVGGALALQLDNPDFADYDPNVLANACGPTGMDFAAFHWYGGKTLAALASVPETDIPQMFMNARTQLGTASYGCKGGADMPIAMTEWGPNTLAGDVVIPKPTATAAPAGSQIIGLFAIETYANLLEQGALAAHWLELHHNDYLAGIDATNDPFTTVNDTPRWGYKGAQMASLLAMGGDKIVKATTTGAFGAALKVHSSVHANGDIAVLMTNADPTKAANVTLSLTGGTAACVGVQYAYTPINTDQDGSIKADWIFANTDGTSVPVSVPPYSAVVVIFPKR